MEADNADSLSQLATSSTSSQPLDWCAVNAELNSVLAPTTFTLAHNDITLEKAGDACVFLPH